MADKTLKLFILMMICSILTLLFYRYYTATLHDSFNYAVKYHQLFQRGERLSPMQPSGKSTDLTDCFTSTSHCLKLIEQTQGQLPQLVSFERKVEILPTHNQTGKPFLVPNIVHLISFGSQQPFMFYNYVAYKSFHKFIQPLAVFLWADHMPSEHSKWWKETLKEVANIYFVPTMPLKQIAGKNITFTAHSSDYLRLIIMRGKPSD